jgi:hypothetical protein
MAEGMGTLLNQVECRRRLLRLGELGRTTLSSALSTDPDQVCS